MSGKVEEIVDTLNLLPHPEGGFYYEYYRSEGKMPCPWSPDEERNFCTAIYFLLTEGNFSALHRIKSDEIWHFYEGDPIEVWVIGVGGEAVCHVISENQRLLVVPAGHWFASRTTGRYSLAGCTVSPGFDFADFEMGNREVLIRDYPELEKLI